MIVAEIDTRAEARPQADMADATEVRPIITPENTKPVGTTLGSRMRAQSVNLGVRSILSFSPSKKQKTKRSLKIPAIKSKPEEKRRLFIYDPPSDLYFLIDTGTDVTVVPLAANEHKKQTDLNLFATNNRIIDTYGEKSMEITSGFKRSFPWRAIITDAQYPIIGANFLASYSLLPDFKKFQLVDGTTKMTSKCSFAKVKQAAVSTLNTTKFAELLADYTTSKQMRMPFPPWKNPCHRDKEETTNRQREETTPREIEFHQETL